MSLTLCLPFFFTGLSQATPLGITILSQSHHIRGEAGSNSLPGEVYSSYDMTSNGPLHSRADGLTQDYGWLDPEVAESWAGDFSVRTFAQRLNGKATAASTYLFQSEFDNLAFDVTVHDDSTHESPVIRYSLVNATTGVQVLSNLYDWSHHASWESNFLHSTEHFDLSLNHEDIYELQLYVNGWGGDCIANTFLDVDMVSVVPNPEPATILLFSVGLAGLAGARRKKKEI